MPAPSPLEYFIFCILLKIDSDSIELEMDNWRTCIMCYTSFMLQDYIYISFVVL